jgi:hypothetical protein
MRLIQLVVPVVAALGCASSPTTRPPVEELKEGLNLIDVSDPDWGVSAAYVKQGHVVYVEQRVGALKPQVYRDTGAADEPQNEIDMRFVDQNGVTFWVQRGGDDYVDPTWSAEINDALQHPAPALDRNADFALAKEAADVLSKSLPKDFAALAYHPHAFAQRPVPSEDPNLAGRLDEIEAKRPDTAYGDWYSGESWWWLQGDLYDKKVCYVWVCVARHSGVAMWAYNGGWGLAVNACNHGSCPGSSNVTYRCSSNSGVWRQWISLTGESSGGNSVGGGCRTNYSWNSGGWDHLCNDDSAYELWQIKNGSQGDGNQWNENGNMYSFIYNGPGTGGDGSWVNYACNCGANNSCNNDWSRPICP